MSRPIAAVLVMVLLTACGGTDTGAPTAPSTSTTVTPATSTTVPAPTTTAVPPTTAPPAASTTTTTTTTTSTTAPPPTTTVVPIGVQDSRACRLNPAEQEFGVGLAIDARPPGRLPTTGTVRAAVLFAEPSGTTAAVSPEDLFEMLSPGAEEMLGAMSYGRWELVLEPHFVWLDIDIDVDAWTAGLTDYYLHRDVVVAAVDAADADVDFSGIDHVIVMAPPSIRTIYTGPTWTGGSPDEIRADGAGVLNAITSGADLLDWGFKWLVHEMGHSLGLEDLYSYEGFPSPTGEFGIMNWISGLAPEFFAYERWALGWIDDDQVVCLDGTAEVTAELAPVETPGGVKAIVVPDEDGGSGIVVESRRALGYDTALDDEGAVVYTVDTDVPTGLIPIEVRNDRQALRAGENVTIDGVTITVVGSASDGDTVRVTFDG